MIVSIPFLYEAVVRLPRKRNPQDVLIHGTWPFEIAELTSDEAPVVVRLPAHPDRSWPKTPETTDIRHNDGTFWVPAVDLMGNDGHPVVQDDYRRWRERKLWVKVAGMFSDGGLRPGKPLAQLESRADAAEIISDNREALAEEIYRQSKDVLVVDGVVHRRCGEPVCILYGDDGRGDYEIATSTLDVAVDKLALNRIFRLDRRDEAIRYAEAKLGNPLPAELIATLADEAWADILDPAALAYDDAKANLLECVGSKLRYAHTHGSSLLNDAPTELLIEMIRLRDAVSAAAADPDDDGAKVAEGWVRFNALIDQGHFFLRSDPASMGVDRWRRAKGIPTLDLDQGLDADMTAIADLR